MIPLPQRRPCFYCSVSGRMPEDRVGGKTYTCPSGRQTAIPCFASSLRSSEKRYGLAPNPPTTKTVYRTSSIDLSTSNDGLPLTEIGTLAFFLCLWTASTMASNDGVKKSAMTLLRAGRQHEDNNIYNQYSTYPASLSCPLRMPTAGSRSRIVPNLTTEDWFASRKPSLVLLSKIFTIPSTSSSVPNRLGWRSSLRYVRARRLT